MSSFIAKNNFIYSTSQEVKNLCASFFTTTKINYFNYYRFFNNGEFYGLITTPELIEHHFSKKRIATPYLPEKPTENKFHYILSADLDDGFSHAVLDFRKFFNFYNPLYLYERSQDYFDLYVYHYSGNPALSFDYYFSNMERLEKWKSEFKINAHKLLTLANKNRIIIPSALRPNNNNYCEPHLSSKSMTSENCITRRQRDCLNFMVLGMTIKEIAKELSLSPRTVEHYLENVKIKWDCSSRSELIRKAIQFLP